MRGADLRADHDEFARPAGPEKAVPRRGPGVPTRTRGHANFKSGGLFRRDAQQRMGVIGLARIGRFADRCLRRMDHWIRKKALEPPIVGSGCQAWKSFDEPEATIRLRPDARTGSMGGLPAGPFAAPGTYEATLPFTTATGSKRRCAGPAFLR